MCDTDQSWEKGTDGISPLDKIFPTLESDPAVTYHLLPCPGKSAPALNPDKPTKRKVAKEDPADRKKGKVHRKSSVTSTTTLPRAIAFAGILIWRTRGASLRKQVASVREVFTVAWFATRITPIINAMKLRERGATTHWAVRWVIKSLTGLTVVQSRIQFSRKRDSVTHCVLSCLKNGTSFTKKLPQVQFWWLAFIFKVFSAVGSEGSRQTVESAGLHWDFFWDWWSLCRGSQIGHR